MSKRSLGEHNCIIKGHVKRAYAKPLRRLYTRHGKDGKTIWTKTNYALCPVCNVVVDLEDPG